jgi:hypothetical protein
VQEESETDSESDIDEETLGLDFADDVDLDYINKRNSKLSAKQQKAATQQRVKGQFYKLPPTKALFDKLRKNMVKRDK